MFLPIAEVDRTTAGETGWVAWLPNLRVLPSYMINQCALGRPSVLLAQGASKLATLVMSSNVSSQCPPGHDAATMRAGHLFILVARGMLVVVVISDMAIQAPLAFPSVREAVWTFSLPFLDHMRLEMTCRFPSLDTHTVAHSPLDLWRREPD